MFFHTIAQATGHTVSHSAKPMPKKNIKHPRSKATQINVLRGNVGENARVLQVYAPGQPPLNAETFVHSPDAQPFSADWLLFHQQRVPLLARETELEELSAFLGSEGGFRWWAMHGPAGAGKSRLALEFVQRHATAWDGGFIPAHQQTVGAIAGWTPASDTLWVLDYASSGPNGHALADILETLALRFCACAFRVRLLLLDRAGGQDSGWWQGLFEQAGRASTLLRQTLFDQPLELRPLREHGSALLESWLRAAGWSEVQSQEKSAEVGIQALTTATDGGRPLFVALVAAALYHNMPAEDMQHLMPLDSIDMWLRRELRLMREGLDESRFGQLCKLLTIATLGGGLGLTEHPGRSQPNVQRNAQANATDLDKWLLGQLSSECGVLNPLKELARLEQFGVSRSTQWALRPDAIGERMLHHMLSFPPSDPQMARVLPSLSDTELRGAVHVALRLSSNHCEVLSRMDDDDVVQALCLLSAHPKSQMKYVLRRMRYLAQRRRTPLSSDFLRSMEASLWGKRHVPAIEDIVRRMLEHSMLTTADDPRLALMGDRLTQAAQSEEFVATLLWLVPYTTAISNLRGPPLHAVLAWLADWQGVLKASSVDDLLLVLGVLDRVVQQMWSHVRTPNGLVDASAFRDGILPLPLVSSMLQLYDQCIERIDALWKILEASDQAEVASRLSTTAVNTSYVLLAGDAATGAYRTAWLEAAAAFALGGQRWAGTPQNYEAGFLCVRNHLAAMTLLQGDRQHSLQTRIDLVENYITRGGHKAAIELLSDGVRLAARHRDLPAMQTWIEMLSANRMDLNPQVELLRQDNISHHEMLEGLIADKRLDDALEYLGMCRRLSLTLPVDAEDGTFRKLSEALTKHALDRDLPNMLRILVAIIEDALEDFLSGAIASADPVVTAMVCMQGLALDRSRLLPWRRLRIEQTRLEDLSADTRRLIDNQTHARHPDARWFFYIWNGEPQVAWFASWASDAPTEVVIGPRKFE